ncbi:MAG: glycosyltransferase [Bacteroidota bacterium]
MEFSFSILYITINENISSQNEGVSKKLLTKINAIQKFCPLCVLLNAKISLTHNEVKVLEKNDHFANVEIGVKEANTGYLNKINSDKCFYKKLAEFIENNGLTSDRIIFRYPYATEGLNLFVKRFDNKIVFEHNSKEIEEQNLNIAGKKYAAFSLIPSRLFYWYQEKKYPIFAERYLSRSILKHAYAGACVTTEIANYERQRTPGYKTFVSSNFYDFSKVQLSNSVYDGKGLLSLGMIVSTTAAWYGLERLLRSFEPFQKAFKLVIAGIDQNDEQIKKIVKEYNITENLTLLGKINKDQLDLFYNSFHVCFGSLALYTLDLNYASTLKVKESLAFGIPVVVGYNEEDFIENKAFSPYYLQIPNNNSKINFEDVKTFAIKFYAQPENKIKLRELALRYMDVDVKMRTLLENIKPVKSAF